MLQERVSRPPADVTEPALPHPQRVLPQTTTSGTLLGLAAVPWGIVQAGEQRLTEAPGGLLGAAGGLSALTLFSAACIMTQPRVARLAATLALLGTFGLAAPQLADSPFAALTALLTGTSALVLLWKIGAPLIELNVVRLRPVLEGWTQGSAFAALIVWLLWTFSDSPRPLTGPLAVGWAISCSAVLSLSWALRNLRTQRLRAVILLVTVVPPIGLVPAFFGDWWWLLNLFLGPAVAAAALVHPRQRTGATQTGWGDPLLAHPERLLVGTFAALCLGGTLLLALPLSAASGESIGFSDAIFTSTSAVCVTGLIVLDTPTAFSPFGQVMLLGLIQVGGLGIMTFSTAALWALGRRVSLRYEGAVATLISPQNRGRLFSTARRIVELTVLVEGIGTLLLAWAFWVHGDPPGQALWRGLFTAVSAFCNAGFALQTDNLIPYQHSAFVLHVTALLIVLGGLSPLAIFALPAIVQRSTAPISAQARLALTTTLGLLALGFLFILAFEWNASLGNLGVMDKLHNAWFQSVTLRTAGFNSVDLTLIRPATLTLMLLWMFVGGSPGGTAGGIKTTTLAILVLSVVQAIRGQWTLEAFARRIPARTLAKAAVIVTISVTATVLALLAIQLTQKVPGRVAIFEVVSALGTVGLSIGGTALLDGIGRGVIIICMFAGRVGGLTLLMFLSSRRPLPTLGRPEEEIDVG